MKSCTRTPSLLLALGMLGVAAFAPSVTAARTSQAGQIEVRGAPVWPASPEVARIRYVQQVVYASDWGAGRPWWGKVADAMTGRREPGFVRPTGVALSPDGVLFVADPGAPAVVILDRSRGRKLRVTRVGDRSLASPVAVAPGPDGSVYVADSGLGEVLQVSSEGVLLRSITDATLQRPSGVAFDAARGRLYVADSRAHVVHVFDSAGKHVAALGALGSGPGHFNAPTHLALTHGGALVVTDALNHRVQILSEDGKSARTIIGEVGDGAGNFTAPKGVAVDRAGNVYAADAMFDAVQVFDESGRLLLGFGDQGTRAGQFWLPNGLYIDDSDRLFVADAYNRRIQVFQLLAPNAPAPEVSPPAAGATP
jgi:DNA-binding beta-propeller fold protein YncE